MAYASAIPGIEKSAPALAAQPADAAAEIFVAAEDRSWGHGHSRSYGGGHHGHGGYGHGGYGHGHGYGGYGYGGYGHGGYGHGGYGGYGK